MASSNNDAGIPENERTPLILRKVSTAERSEDFDADSCDSYTMAARNEPVGFDRSFGLTCIVLHECLHSAAFYMIVPGLLYFVRSRDMLSDGWAVIVTLIFAGVAFFLPLIGGIIGDTVMGRYTAVLFGTVIELIGMVILLIYSIIMHFKGNIKLQWDMLSMLIVSLVLVAFGMGFIKANVNPFGAGQLQETGGSAEKIQAYFRWYTFAINFGKLLAFFPVALLLNKSQMNVTDTTNSSAVPFTTFTPTIPTIVTTLVPNITTKTALEMENGTFQPVEILDVFDAEDGDRDYKAVIATTIQVCFVGVAIFIFMMGKAKYKMVPPTGGKHMDYIFCFYRRRFSPYMYHEHHEYIAKMQKYQKMVFRITFITAALFAMYIFYEAIYFQLLSTFMLQARELAQPIPNVNLPLPFMNTFQNVIIIVSIPILERCCNCEKKDYVSKEEVEAEAAKKSTVERINKTLVDRSDDPNIVSISQTRHRGATVQAEDSTESVVVPVSDEVKQQIALELAARKRRKTLLTRMCIGMVFAALVALSAGILESVRKWRVANNLEKPSLFWQLPQYVLMGIAEVFGVISAYEFAFTESFPGVQGFTTGMFISSYGLGSFVALFLYLGLSDNSSTGDLNPNLNEMNLDGSYYGLSATMVILLILFYILGQQYQCKGTEHLTEPKHPAGLTEPSDFDAI
ncbi:uncharacterized protein LOC135487005 isoform X2 [Lineus longissimus]|uniref:uncharacterized protein LOC135487005 isoform X2 n=1 Tax=Lineus longissimus TaxID=88925 RepID=UPI002B4D04BB